MLRAYLPISKNKWEDFVNLSFREVFKSCSDVVLQPGADFIVIAGHGKLECAGLAEGKNNASSFGNAKLKKLRS